MDSVPSGTNSSEAQHGHGEISFRLQAEHFNLAS